MSIIRPNSGPTFIDRTKYFFRSHSRYFGSASAADLAPAGLGRARRVITDQRDSDLCTAYGEAVSSSYEQGKDMNPEWQAAAESKYIGSAIVAGADPIPSMQATEVTGSLPQAYLPVGFTLALKGAQFICNWANWPTPLWEIAERYLPGIPYTIDGPYDIFDNIRTALFFAYADNKSVVKVFGPWFDMWNMEASAGGSTGILSNPSNQYPISSHRWNFIDWTTMNGQAYLVAQLTQGTDFGDKGFLYFDRATINAVFSNPAYSLLITRSRRGNLDSLLLMFQSILYFLQNQVNGLQGRV